MLFLVLVTHQEVFTVTMEVLIHTFHSYGYDGYTTVCVCAMDCKKNMGCGNIKNDSIVISSHFRKFKTLSINFFQTISGLLLIFLSLTFFIELNFLEKLEEFSIIQTATP